MRFIVFLAVSSLVTLAQPVPFPKPNYCFGFLNAVPNRPDLPQEEAQRIQAAHMAHLHALGEKRWLLGAGPILTPGNLRGLLISRCQSVEEANELASADPAVQNKRLSVESYAWSGPPGIADAYWQEKAQNPAEKDRMQKHPIAFLRKSPSWQGWPAKEVFAAHFAHLESLRKAGAVAAAGPFHNGGDRLGVVIFGTIAIDEARRLAEQDPLVQGGHARVEILEWLVADGVLPKPR